MKIVKISLQVIGKLALHSLGILIVIAACLAAGCRMFTFH